MKSESVYPRLPTPDHCSLIQAAMPAYLTPLVFYVMIIVGITSYLAPIWLPLLAKTALGSFIISMDMLRSPSIVLTQQSSASSRAIQNIMPTG